MTKRKQQGRIVAHRDTDDTVGERGWQPSDVLRIMTNPIYVGFGPIPPMMADDEWVAASVKVVGEVGLERYLHALIENLRDAFQDVEDIPGMRPPYGYRLK